MRAAALVIVLAGLSCDNNRWEAPQCPEPIDLQATRWVHEDTGDSLVFVDGRVVLIRADQTASDAMSMQPAPDFFTPTDCRRFGPLDTPTSDRKFVSLSEADDGYELRLRTIGMARFELEAASQGSMIDYDTETKTATSSELISSIVFADDGRELIARLESVPERVGTRHLNWNLTWDITTSAGEILHESSTLELYIYGPVGDTFHYETNTPLDCI